MRSDFDQTEGADGEQQVDVTVSFSGRSGPVTGTVSRPGGEGTPFHGWLELMDELERIRDPLNRREPV